MLFYQFLFILFQGMSGKKAVLDAWLQKPTNGKTSKESLSSEQPNVDNEPSAKKRKCGEVEASPSIQLSSGDNQDCSDHDVGLYLNKPISDNIKEKLLNSPWIPPPSFNFPTVSNRKLKFQCKWMNHFPWLVYSKHAGGALCKVCVTFNRSTGGRGDQRLGALVTKSFSNWKNALEVFRSHSETEYHKFSVQAAESFRHLAAGKQTPVSIQVNQEKARQAKENRAKLLPIVETIILCGRQELALRGTDDHGEIGETSSAMNDGNFRALLRFRVSAGDTVLKNHLESSAHNARYCSPRIQNELINICGDVIRDEIVKNVNKASCFTVLADETTDVSRKEQMSVCLRYVDENDGKIHEEFLQFVSVQDLRGEGIAKSIIGCLKKNGVNTEFMVGQGYDGAAAMSGHLQGAQAFIRKEFPTAVYVHCSAHSLNLAIGDSCKMPLVRNCLGSVAAVITYFNSSAQRTQVLKEAIKENFPTSLRSSLLSMCETRWVLKRQSLLRFKEVLVPIIQALNSLEESRNGETSEKAHQLCSAISSGQFVVALYTAEKLFSFTLPLCLMLQKIDCDLAAACEYVDDILGVTEDMRSNAEEEFHAIFLEASEVLGSIGEELTLPRVAKKQIHRDNIPASTPEEYYRRNLFIPFLDHFQIQLRERFSNHRKLLSSIHKIIPKFAVSSNSKDLEECVNFFKSLLPEPGTFNSEFRLWQSKWLKVAVQSQPVSAIEAYFVCSADLFPNVKTLLRILATLPVSTATAERTFSTLRRLKNYLRNSTGQDRMTGLALLSVHRTINVDPQEVIRRFALSPRKGDFIL